MLKKSTLGVRCLATRHTSVSKREVSDSNLPSEAPEPRLGILTIANERDGRGGEADSGFS